MTRGAFLLRLFALLAAPFISIQEMVFGQSRTPVADFVEHTYNSGGMLPTGTYVLERTIHLNGNGVIRDSAFEYNGTGPILHIESGCGGEIMDSCFTIH